MNKIDVMMKNVVEYVWNYVGDFIGFSSYEIGNCRAYKAICFGKKWKVVYDMEEGECLFKGIQDDGYDYDNDPDGLLSMEDDTVVDPDRTIYLAMNVIPEKFRLAIEDDFRKRGELDDAA